MVPIPPVQATQPDGRSGVPPTDPREPPVNANSRRAHLRLVGSESQSALYLDCGIRLFDVKGAPCGRAGGRLARCGRYLRPPSSLAPPDLDRRTTYEGAPPHQVKATG
jgi:hypothetical protein